MKIQSCENLQYVCRMVAGREEEQVGGRTVIDLKGCHRLDCDPGTKGTGGLSAVVGQKQVCFSKLQEHG